MKLATRHESIEIAVASAEETQELVEISGLSDARAEQSTALALRSRKGTGLVLCKRASAWVGGADPVGNPGTSAEEMIVWSSR
ncbi:hypothetical protein [Streptomyces sp. NPDC049949]|uniref:hypothetical protein n=1 Tax=Streptomyces sp. NPDC049949 TaxID=3154627 RepID=UPI003426D470